MLKVIGQRWLLNIPNKRVVVEVSLDGIAKVIQIIDLSGPYILGDSMNLNLNPEAKYWEYMAGQDKPKE